MLIKSVHYLDYCWTKLWSIILWTSKIKQYRY